MKLILTRHGETIENQQGILQGHIPGRLSKRGIQQAKKLALRLKDEKIDYIYSSDLSRSADTAKEIAKYHPKSPIYFVGELRECNLGKYEGMKWEKMDWNARPKEIESRKNMQKRVKKLFDLVYNKYPKATVLFVGHAGINLALMTVILNKSIDYMDKFYSQPNTAISIFEIKKDKNHVVHLMNCIKHLE